MDILKYFISVSSITAAIIFIGKIVASKLFDGLVETYKHKLNMELEEFKANQQKVLDEYKIRYSRLHEDRANIIVELYKKLVRIESKLEDFVQWNRMMRIDPTITPNRKFNDLDAYSKEKYKETMEALNKELFYDFFEFVDENDIFFTEDLVDSLIKLNKILSTMRNLADMSKETFEKGEFEHKLKNGSEESNVFIETLRNIKNIKKELQKEFRTLLGVNK